MGSRAGLSVVAIQKKKKPGRYCDGRGLYLQVARAGTKSWIFRYTRSGRAHEMGLGPVHLIPLVEARARAWDCQRQLLDGIDPLEARTRLRRQRDLAQAKALTFDQCAASYIAAHRAGWKSVKHASQWESTLREYAGPVFGSLSVAEVDTALVVRVLEPIWKEKTETASRLRNRIELVLDWATVRNYRTGENPARWRGHLDKLLPKPSAVRSRDHFAALPYTDAPSFLVDLRQQSGLAPLALEFLILTAARTSEAIGARWDEIDLRQATWTVPSTRMKGKKEHRVPLAPRALEILEAARKASDGEFVFPGRQRGRSLSNMALLKVLARMKREVTAHGFRSSFRDWAAECADFPREVAEAALAHKLKDKVEAAYQRSDLLERRRNLMNQWAGFVCSQTPAPRRPR